MNSMKNKPSLTNPILFLVFLVLGAFTAFAFNREVHAAQPTLAPRTKGKPAVSGQANSLLAIVDRVDARQALLEGLWLVIEYPSTYDYSLIALYPSPETDPQQGTSRQEIWINPKDFSTITNLELVTAQEVWWEHVYLIDEIAINQLLGLTGGFAYEEQQITNISQLHVIPLALQSSAQSYQTQKTFLSEICLSNSTPQTLSFIEKTYPLHLYTDVNRMELIGHWQRIVAGGPEIQCAFFEPGQ
jgi:hypothetical protein